MFVQQMYGYHQHAAAYHNQYEQPRRLNRKYLQWLGVAFLLCMARVLATFRTGSPPTFNKAELPTITNSSLVVFRHRLLNYSRSSTVYLGEVDLQYTTLGPGVYACTLTVGESQSLFPRLVLQHLDRLYALRRRFNGTCDAAGCVLQLPNTPQCTRGKRLSKAEL